MAWLLDPLSAQFLQRALLGGALVAVVCGIVGTWVVIRGMAFLGEAIGHGMLPGVAIATVTGAPVLLGAALAAAVMTAAVGLLQRRGRLSYDTSIGLLFVGMLSLGVIVVSHSRSFATDATALLFGDILAVGIADLIPLVIAAAATVLLAVVFHRSFVVTAFDPRIAHVLGLRPALAHVVLVGLVTLAVVASFPVVGSLLVVGLLLAPAVAARPWTRTIPATMLIAALFGMLAVIVGLLISWHLGTAAGASIALTAVLLAFLSGAARARLRRRGTSQIVVRTQPAAPVHARIEVIA
ncbi:zinc ABC transporter permease AztB [Microbacterium sp. ZW T5_56]|uniref:zinc ABC transporter permease AztB n=1 Tax=Microbacterium sp. ZW T5_56 TaxID=3378081 RepID=UPI003854C900